LETRDPAVLNLQEGPAEHASTRRRSCDAGGCADRGAAHYRQWIDELAGRRAPAALIWDTGKIATTKHENLAEGQGLDYKDYFRSTRRSG